MIKDYIARIREGSCTATELTLTAIILFLFGMLIGMLIAPSRFLIFGSFNGNSGSVDVPWKKKNKIEEKV